MKKIKIVYYNPKPSGCTWYRFIIPITALKALDLVDFEYLYFKSEYPEIQSDDLEKLKTCDIFHIAREWTAYGSLLIKEAKKLGKKIWYDVDDNLFNIPTWNVAYKVFTQPRVRNGLLDILKQVDLVTITQDKLREEYVKHTKAPIKILPNIAPYGFFKKEVKEDGYIRILWAGSQTHVDDLKLIEPVIEQILKEFPNVYFTFVGFCLPSILNLDKVRIKLVDPDVFVQTYYVNLMKASPDIALAPLADVNFNWYKSNIKLLEYGTLDCAVVASKIGEYGKFIKHKQEGLLCSKYIEWYKALKLLITNAEIRKILSTNLRNKVNALCNPSVFVGWYNMFLELLKIEDSGTINIETGFFEKWYNLIYEASTFYEMYMPMTNAKPVAQDINKTQDDLDDFFKQNKASAT